MVSKLAGLKVLAVMTCVGMLAACASQQEQAPPEPAQTAVEQAPATVETDRVESEQIAGPAAGSIEDLIATVGSDRVFFAYDSAELSADARETLRKEAEWLRVNGGVALTIEGHCDERGTREYNLALGERRANAVRSYLMALGVSGDRLKTISYGKERPAVLGSTETSWAQNRRGVSVIAPGSMVN